MSTRTLTYSLTDNATAEVTSIEANGRTLAQIVSDIARETGTVRTSTDFGKDTLTVCLDRDYGTPQCVIAYQVTEHTARPAKVEDPAMVKAADDAEQLAWDMDSEDGI